MSSFFMLPTYEFHNKTKSLKHFGDVDFWPYLVAFKAIAPSFLRSDQPKIIGPKVVLIYEDNVTKFPDA